MVASRWPQRLSLAALISFSISVSVRYSRVRARHSGAGRGDCPILGGWGDDSEVRFHPFSSWLEVNCGNNTCFTDSCRGGITASRPAANADRSRARLPLASLGSRLCRLAALAFAYRSLRRFSGLVTGSNAQNRLAHRRTWPSVGFSLAGLIANYLKRFSAFDFKMSDGRPLGSAGLVPAIGSALSLDTADRTARRIRTGMQRRARGCQTHAPGHGHVPRSPSPHPAGGRGEAGPGPAIARTPLCPTIT